MAYQKQRQVTAIYANKYDVLFTDPDKEKVLAFAKANRAQLKKGGALRVITNYGFYKIPSP